MTNDSEWHEPNVYDWTASCVKKYYTSPWPWILWKQPKELRRMDDNFLRKVNYSFAVHLEWKFILIWNPTVYKRMDVWNASANRSMFIQAIHRPHMPNIYDKLFYSSSMHYRNTAWARKFVYKHWSCTCTFLHHKKTIYISLTSETAEIKLYYIVFTFQLL